MGLFSSIGSFFSKAAGSVGGLLKKAGAAAAPLVKKVMAVQTKLAQVGDLVVPGAGSFVSSMNDFSGGMMDKLYGSSAPTVDPAEDPYVAMDAAVSDEQSLGTSPVALAMSSSMEATSRPLAATSSATASKGFLGIGDGKPGVFGIGTGKNKARKAAEAAALAAGATAAQASAAGQRAADAVKEDGPAAAESSDGIKWLIGGVLALLALA